MNHTSTIQAALASVIARIRHRIARPGTGPSAAAGAGKCYGIARQARTIAAPPSMPAPPRRQDRQGPGGVEIRETRASDKMGGKSAPPKA
jgi:uncharacterized membrane protein